MGYLSFVYAAAICLGVVAWGVAGNPRGKRQASGNEYVDYLPGTGLKVILSAPHGGDLKPSSIPDRDAGCWTGSECIWTHDCGTKDYDNCDAVTTKDLYTQELARELRDALFAQYGSYPATVINLLHRVKLDANRDVDEATFNVPEAVDAWNAYMGSLEQARTDLGGFALYLDIHGHGHPNVWAELGYLISGANLDSGNFDEADSSIRNLAASTTFTFDDLLRGAPSFGGYLEGEGFESVPSPTNNGPNGDSYFSGGYITQRFGSRDGGVTDCIQIESPRDFREMPTRAQYVDAISRIVSTYLEANGQSVL